MVGIMFVNFFCNMPYTESVIFGQPDFLYDMFVEFVMSSDSTMFSPWLLARLVLGHSLFSVTCSVKVNWHWILASLMRLLYSVHCCSMFIINI